MKKYQVIGGQYESVWYGESDTLLGAKQIATKHTEYWDNWQGWHTPDIYLAEDTQVITSHGRVTTPDGWEIIVPKDEPICVKAGGKWEIRRTDGFHATISRWTKNPATFRVDENSEYEKKVINGGNAKDVMAKINELRLENDLAKFTPWVIDEFWD